MAKLPTHLIMMIIAMLWMLSSIIPSDRDGKLFALLTSQLWLVGAMLNRGHGQATEVEVVT